MTKVVFSTGALALTLTLGLATSALAKPDYLDRMNPRPARPPAAAQQPACDCPMMHGSGRSATTCMTPQTLAPPHGQTKG